MKGESGCLLVFCVQSGGRVPELPTTPGLFILGDRQIGHILPQYSILFNNSSGVQEEEPVSQSAYAVIRNAACMLQTRKSDIHRPWKNFHRPARGFW